MQFVARAQQAEPVVAALLDKDNTVGYFSGLMINRLGLRILGSPFPGWTTQSMGFTLTGAVTRRDAAAALPAFAFRSLGCVHLEAVDRQLDETDLEGLGFKSSTWHSYELRLGADEEMLRGFTGTRRRAIQKAARVGVVVEQATGVNFADEYHEQMREVFAHKSLAPNYGVQRVRDLIAALEPTGQLLLLRAFSPDGVCIATMISPAFGGTAYFWGGASIKKYQVLNPNEALVWHALQYWRDRGMSHFDFGGVNDYKRRYGGTQVSMVEFRRSRLKGIAAMRDVGRKAVTLHQIQQGKRASQGDVK
jgi:hypothetical protein